MRRWVGRLVLLLGVTHISVALIGGWDDLSDILRGGVGGLMSAQDGHEAVFWSMLFGVVLALVGYQLDWSARHFDAIPAIPGVVLIIVGLFGGLLAPSSPFWLIVILGVMTVIAARTSPATSRLSAAR